MAKRSPIPLLALLALLLVLATPAEAVVNGTVARRADYPFFAVVGAGCGGALVRPDRVLTAAHCLDALSREQTVRVGPRQERRRVRLHAIDPVHVRELERIPREFPPPAADLMLLGLERPIRDVRPVRIATAAEGLTAPGLGVVTIGRGATASDGRGQGTFRTGSVALQPLRTCAEQLGSALLRRWSLCTRDPRMADQADPGPFASACVGDSGGPLLAGPAAAQRLIGVVSWGPSCGKERDPEIYANAVRGRAFALARHPIWAPQAIGEPRVAGTARVGRTVRCVVRWLVLPTRRLRYSFTLDRFQFREGRRPTYRIKPTDAGHRLSCSAGGATAGGRGGPPGLAPPRLVRR